MQNISSLKLITEKLLYLSIIMRRIGHLLRIKVVNHRGNELAYMCGNYASICYKTLSHKQITNHYCTDGTTAFPSLL